MVIAVSHSPLASSSPLRVGCWNVVMDVSILNGMEFPAAMSIPSGMGVEKPVLLGMRALFVQAASCNQPARMVKSTDEYRALTFFRRWSCATQW